MATAVFVARGSDMRYVHPSPLLQNWSTSYNFIAHPLPAGLYDIKHDLLEFY